MHPPLALSTVFLAVLTAACSHGAKDTTASFGAAPLRLAPSKALLPVVNVAKAVGWSDGERPTAVAGTQAVVFAQGLDRPRLFHLLPDGDAPVAVSSGPPQPGVAMGPGGFAMVQVTTAAGTAVPSADRISLLHDSDGDGIDRRGEHLVADDGSNSFWQMSAAVPAGLPATAVAITEGAR